jgi:hypothetical protein
MIGKLGVVETSKDVFSDGPIQSPAITERYIWLLFGAGVLLFLAMFILCARLWLLLRSCHCST